MLHYETRTSTGTEMNFVHHEIADQVQAGHTVFFYLSSIHGIHKLWLSTVDVIPQVGRCPRPILDFTWSGLNNTTSYKDP